MNKNRYQQMKYIRCGNSGIKLPAISLGLWHNWGGYDAFENAREMIITAFDHGITHFDLANNYGPPPGSAEENFGRILKKDLAAYRDELIISSKAGYEMWKGPYGDWGSRKYLITSCNQSLKRIGLEYVDIFYHHRPDPQTPLEETMGALDQIVRSGKALYAGLSNYPAELTHKASSILKKLGTPCLIHQPKYNMFDRWIEDKLLDTLEQEKIGSIVFSPLAQGLLTDKYLNGIPKHSRAANPHGFLQENQITPAKVAKVKQLNEIAKERGQNLSQLALVWVLRKKQITSALIGASKPAQITEACTIIDKMQLSDTEAARIESILSNP